MTHADRQILFTALGFLAVIMRDDVPQNKQGLRALAIADLIEAFCRSALPETFDRDDSQEDLDEASCL